MVLTFVTASSPSLVVDTLGVSPSSMAASSNTSLAVDARDVKPMLLSKTSNISLAVVSLVVDTFGASPLSWSSTAAHTSLAVEARDVKTTLSSKTSNISLAGASELDDVQTEILIQKKRAHARLVRLREVVDDGGDARYTFVERVEFGGSVAVRDPQTNTFAAAAAGEPWCGALAAACGLDVAPCMGTKQRAHVAKTSRRSSAGRAAPGGQRRLGVEDARQRRRRPWAPLRI